jgi:hypothetical protein
MGISINEHHREDAALCGRLKTSYNTAQFEEDGPLFTRKSASQRCSQRLIPLPEAVVGEDQSETLKPLGVTREHILSVEDQYQSTPLSELEKLVDFVSES